MKYYSLFIILAIGLVIRLINLDQSLWWDEAINVVYAKQNDFWWFVTKYPLSDFHPPGYFAILWVWGQLFGFFEISVRFPSVIFGLLTIFLTYLIGKELFSEKTGKLAALFLTFAPLHIYYSQEARMYSFAAFAVSLSAFFLIKFLKEKKWGAGYFLSIGLLLYSDYLVYFIPLTHFLYIYIFHKKILKSYIINLILGVIFVIPWFIIFPKQFAGGQATSFIITGWKDVVGGTGIKETLLLPIKIITGRISFDNNLLYALLFALLALPFILSFIKLLKSKIDFKISLLLFWLILPPLLAIIISFWIPIFSYFRFIFILPAFYILIALGMEKFSPKLSRMILITVIISEIVSSAIYLFNPKFYREDWKGAINFVEQSADETTIVLHKNSEIPAPFRYYKNADINTAAAFKTVPVDSKNDLIELENKLYTFDKIYLLNYLVDITDPKRLLEDELQNLGFSRKDEYNFRGVGIISLYEK